MYQPNKPFMTDFDTMLAMSPYSNQYQTNPEDLLAGGYGNIGNIDKVLTLLAQGGLAALEGTAVDPTSKTKKSNFPPGVITNESLPSGGGNQRTYPLKINDPDFDWTTINGTIVWKPKGSGQKWFKWEK